MCKWQYQRQFSSFLHTHPIVFPLCYWARSQQAAGQKGAALLPKNLSETPTPETCEPQPYSLGVISPL